MGENKLALKNELYRQLNDVTERLLANPELRERQLLNERRLGIQKLIEICTNRNKF